MYYAFLGVRLTILLLGVPHLQTLDKKAADRIRAMEARPIRLLPLG
jgi:hypothetical protein